MSSIQRKHVVKHVVQPEPEALLPLSAAVLHILLVLADGDRHGYSIMREVERVTHGQLRLGPTTLYRAIKQLLASGLLAETDERPDPELDDERRRYYRLTTFGRQVALAETRRLEAVLAIARSKALLPGDATQALAPGGA